MSPKLHRYALSMQWTGNNGTGTSDYQSYSRNHIFRIKNKPDLEGSSDIAFRGDATKYNPEELLVASLSSCHMLWYLHLCCNEGIIVEQYEDNAEGLMQELSDGSGKFEKVILRPTVIISREDMVEKAKQLHEQANAKCFIANSCNFPVHHEPRIMVLK